MGSLATTVNTMILTSFGGSSGDNEVLYWWQGGGSPTWRQQTVATNLTGYGWPAIAWTGTAAIIAAIDLGGDLYYWWQAADTTEWHKQLVGKAGVKDVPF